MPTEPFCRKCGKVWSAKEKAWGHEARCKGVPGLVSRVSKIQSAPTPPTPSTEGSPEGPREGPQGPQRLGSAPPTWAPPPLVGPSAAQLIEARVATLEQENKVLKEVVLNDLQHLGQPAPPQETTSPLPWIVLGGVLALGGLWLFGAFGEVPDERELGLGDAQRRPSMGGVIAGKLIDKAASKILDKAIGKIF